MADLTNRSRFCVTVKNRDDLTRHFSFSKLAEVEVYMAELRGLHLKPRVSQLDETATSSRPLWSWCLICSWTAVGWELSFRLRLRRTRACLS